MSSALLLVLALTAGPLPESEGPALVDEVLLLLRSGLGQETILAYVHTGGVAEPLTPEKERALRAAGATENLLSALRERATPPAAADPKEGPAGLTPESGVIVSAPGTIFFEASVDAVRVPVSVTDGRGRPVAGLEREEFRLWEDGKAQPIDVFSTERKPLRIVVLLDVSGSMEVKIDEVADSLKHFIELLEPEDQVLVLTFSDRPRVIQDFTADRKLLAKAFRRLRPGGGTALHDAVIEGLSHLGPGPAESKALALITDGMDTASLSSFRDALEAARRAEVPVYSIGLGHRRGFSHFGGSTGDPADFDAEPLLELAQQTGGRAEVLEDVEHHHRGNVDRLKDAAEAIAAALRHRYVLGYQPPAGIEGAWREIRVEVARASVSVNARRGYYSER